jgi:hypothetical protein
MPPRRSNKKKKTKSESAVTCAQCSTKVSFSSSIKCICTRVVFCSEACKGLALAPSGRHSCTGPPDDVINVNQLLRDTGSEFRDPSLAQAYNEEYRRTVTDPMNATLVRHGLWSPGVSPQANNISENIRFADQGDVAFAYLAGTRFRLRMMGDVSLRGGNLVPNNTGQYQHLGVLETNELAFKYLSQAAEGNLALAMQSVAECYANGYGVRRNNRMCREWMWRASLLHSTGALPKLESMSLLPLELNAQCQMLESTLARYPPGQPVLMAGPNIGCLLAALYQPLSEQRYMLPAFASGAPTLRVGGRPCQGTTGAVAIFAADTLKKVVSGIDQLVRNGNGVTPMYGRRGVAKSATAQSYSAVSRPLDSILFVVPPAPGCDETPTDDEVMHWRAEAAAGSSEVNRYGNPRNLEVTCVHNERGSGDCRQCIADARERLSAVSRGSVALALQETLDGRGFTAFFRRADGTIKSESFKDYGRGEVECGLAALVASHVADCHDSLIVHPLFVAQDPNLFWLLVLNHGCIRAALEHVAPHVDWDAKVGPVKAHLEQAPIISEVWPGSVLRKCGNEICIKLERNGSKGTFSVCARCKRRHYCCQKCQKTDWTLHRRECIAAAEGRKPTMDPAIPFMAVNDTDRSTKHDRRDSQPAVGEKVVIHSLVSKTELNGCCGVISGPLTHPSERYPVKIGGASIIAVKPTNFHRLAVFVVERKGKKKARKFECFEHGYEVCSNCSVDFSIVNHLSKLCFTEAVLSRDTVERCAESHFASIIIPSSYTDPGGYFGDSDADGCCQGETDAAFPIECQGLQSAEKRFILKALLESEDESLLVVATIAGMACFGGRSLSLTRPNTIPHLEALVTVLNQNLA